MEENEMEQVCFDVNKSILKDAQKELLGIKGKYFTSTNLEYLFREAVQDFERKYEEVF